MYAWKCWRETHARFFILLTSLSVITLTCVVFPMLWQQRGHLHLNRAVYLHDPQFMVRQVVSELIFSSTILLWTFFAGLFLGATTSAREFESGTIEFLWTRPRTRARFLWTHWGVCLAELLALAAIPMLLAEVLLGYLSGYWSEWRLLAAVPMFALTALPILGLTILMTTLRRSAGSGQIFTVAIVIAYLWLMELLSKLLDYPFSPGGMFWLKAYYEPKHIIFPWGSIERAIVLAIALPLLAQYFLRRAEV